MKGFSFPLFFTSYSAPRTFYGADTVMVYTTGGCDHVNTERNNHKNDKSDIQYWT